MPNGMYTTDSKETAVGNSFPGCVQIDENKPGTPCPQPSRKDWSFAERITKKGKVKWAIYKFYSLKSAGLDGVFPALLKDFT